jgi:hypothetical protein
MHPRFSEIKQLVVQYRQTKCASPGSIRLPSIKTKILLAILNDTKKNIQMNFLRRLQTIIENPASIEAAIKDRQSIPKFTSLKDCDFATVKYDRPRVEQFIKEFLLVKQENIRHTREAIIVEGILTGAYNLINTPYRTALTALLANHFDDDDIQYIAEIGLHKVLEDFCGEAVQSLCCKDIKMELEDPIRGYRFKQDFLDSLAAKLYPRPAPVTRAEVAALPTFEKTATPARVQPRTIKKPSLTITTQAPTLKVEHTETSLSTAIVNFDTPRATLPARSSMIVAAPKQPFSKRHPSLFIYLTAMGFVLGFTAVLLGLCFIPFVGPAISSGVGSAVASLSTLLGLETALEAIATAVAATVLAYVGTSVSLISAAGMLGVTLLGAANAAFVTLATGVTECIDAFKRRTVMQAIQAMSPKIGSSTKKMLEPMRATETVKKSDDDFELILPTIPTTTSGIASPPAFSPYQSKRITASFRRF